MWEVGSVRGREGEREVRVFGRLGVWAVARKKGGEEEIRRPSRTHASRTHASRTHVITNGFEKPRQYLPSFPGNVLAEP